MTGPNQGVAGRVADEYVNTRETKPGFMTSEFISSIVAAIGVLIASAVSDTFDAGHAWTLVTALSIGYMLSRGLAKGGVSRYRS